MGDPPSPEGRGTPAGQFFTKTCQHCGRHERCSRCQAEDCGQCFVPQPGYNTRLCPLHDDELDKAPGTYRAYKMKKSMQCAQCGERILIFHDHS